MLKLTPFVVLVLLSQGESVLRQWYVQLESSMDRLDIQECRLDVKHESLSRLCHFALYFVAQPPIFLSFIVCLLWPSFGSSQFPLWLVQ